MQVRKELRWPSAGSRLDARQSRLYSICQIAKPRCGKGHSDLCDEVNETVGAQRRRSEPPTHPGNRSDSFDLVEIKQILDESGNAEIAATTLVELEFLSLRGEEVERFVSNRIGFALVFKEGDERNPAMRPDLSEGDLTLFEQPNHKRPRDVQNFGRLVRRNFLAQRYDTHGISRSCLFENLDQELERQTRKRRVLGNAGPAPELQPHHVLA
jgi:hypothetical protein